MFVAWIFALLLDDLPFAATNVLDGYLVDFIVDATPVLFPPARITAYLCLDKDETISLSREMSRNRLTHEIRDRFDGFHPTIHDSFDHLNLYVLDLDCEYAVQVLQTANSSELFVAPAKWLLLDDRRDIRRDIRSDHWITLFEDMAVYPDSDVVLATGRENRFLQVSSIYRPSPYRRVILEDRGNWTVETGVLMKNHHAASRRRRNLQLTPLKSCIVMTDPDTINHLTDYGNKHIDGITKATYVWTLHLVNRMNATVSFDILNTWGYRDENGSWSGMIGMLQRREIDIGGTGTFFVAERLGVVEYIQLYTHTGSKFIFRQPLLSTVSNIFTLPFGRSVWISIAGLLLSVFFLLRISTKWEYRQRTTSNSDEFYMQLNPTEQTLSDNLMVLLGAAAQQGYSYEPYRVPSRIVTLMLLIAALSLYTSYTAKIVALLQSTTDEIKTISDLYESPLKLGVLDIVYNRYYFKAFQDPVRKAIVDDKVESKDQKSSAWMTLEEGVERMRNELFAFHGEVSMIYSIMQDTYQEEEKCGLTEIDFFKLLYPLMVIQARSPYVEIIKNGALLLRETGLKYRDEDRLFTKKPTCHGQTSFISIGFTESYFALVSMGYGALLSIAVLAIEFLWHKSRKSQEVDADPGFQSTYYAD